MAEWPISFVVPIVAAAVGLSTACSEELPPPTTDQAAGAPMLSDGQREDLERVEIDVETAVRELDLEIDRLEEEWEPDSSEALVEKYVDDVNAVRKRVREIRQRLEIVRPYEDRAFARVRRDVERHLARFDHRIEVLETTIGHGVVAEGERGVVR